MNVRHKRLTAYVALAVLLVLILVFVPFPQRSSLKAVVTPSAAFHVLSNGGGAFSTVLMDNWHNKTLASQNFVPQRGGMVQYAGRGDSKGAVVSGDTLAHFISSSILDKIATLEGNISTLRAYLEFERSGGRESEIEAARLQLDYAKTRYSEQLKVLERSKILLDRNVITQQEYEIDARKERLNAIRVSIAEADLGSALTGAQISKLEVLRAQITDEENKLFLAKQLLADMTITSPISGQLFYPLDVDSLIMVGKTDSMVIVLPIQRGSQSSIEWQSNLILSGTDFELEVSPDQLSIDNQILGASNAQLVLARIIVDNSDNKLSSGQLLEASISFKSQSLFQIVREMF